LSELRTEEKLDTTIGILSAPLEALSHSPRAAHQPDHHAGGSWRNRHSTSYNDNLSKFRAEAAKGWIEINPAYSYAGLQAVTHAGPLILVVPPSQQAVQIDDFARCVRDDQPTRVPGEMGRRDMVIIQAIYASAAQGGKRVEIAVWKGSSPTP
jgi:predicted dehydrogenase